MLHWHRAGGRAMITIKKYSNRRLYDTQESRYITLDELHHKIRGDADVHVVDAKTNADLTQTTLAQIVIESRGAARMLPVPLLVQMIRMGDDALAEFLGHYMSWALSVYGHMRTNARSIANPFNMFRGAWNQALNNPMMGGVNPEAQPWQPPGQPWGASQPPPPSWPQPPASRYSAPGEPAQAYHPGQHPAGHALPPQPVANATIAAENSELELLKQQIAELREAMLGHKPDE